MGGQVTIGHKAPPFCPSVSKKQQMQSPHLPNISQGSVSKIF
jgi:hypothetical protein